MASKRKAGRKIDEFSVRCAGKVHTFEVRMFGRGKGTSFTVDCDALGLSCRGKNLGEVCEEAEEKLYGSVEATWTRWIIILLEEETYVRVTKQGAHDDNGHVAGFAFGYEIVWIAEVDGEFLGWNHDGQGKDLYTDRFKLGRSKRDFFGDHEHVRIKLPYSDELHARLEAFRDRIALLREQLWEVMEFDANSDSEFPDFLAGKLARVQPVKALVPDSKVYDEHLKLIAKPKKKSAKKRLKKRMARKKARR